MQCKFIKSIQEQYLMYLTNILWQTKSRKSIIELTNNRNLNQIVLENLVSIWPGENITCDNVALFQTQPRKHTLTNHGQNS